MKRLVVVLSVFCLFTILFSGCSKKPGSVITDFYKAKSWEEKKSLIVDSKNLKASDVYDEDATYEVKDIELEKKLSNNSFVYKFTRIKTLDGKAENRVVRFLVTNIDNAEKIDIKTTYKINDMTFLQYKENKPEVPQRFWVRVGLTTVPFFGIDLPALEFEDATCRIDAIIPSKNCPEDILKMKKIAVNESNKIILIEFSPAKITKDPYIQSRDLIDAQKVKFIEADPVKEE